MKKLSLLSFFKSGNKNTMPRLASGFTLIELLVVIAIIGILSSVVLASLNTARGKGADAAIKSGMSNTRAQAELWYGTIDGYTGLCTSQQFASMLAQATSTGGGPSTGIICNADSSSWSAYSSLKTGGYWCAGSSGASKATTTIPGGATPAVLPSSCQ